MKTLKLLSALAIAVIFGLSACSKKENTQADNKNNNTTNPDAKWELISSGVTDDLNRVFFIDNNSGWAVGVNGVIIHTTDGGTTWVQQTSNVTKSLNSVFFRDAATGWVVGSGGTILKTTNGGATWEPQSNGHTTTLYTICFNTINNGWAGGSQDTMYHTLDGGNTWSVYCPTNTDSKTDLSIRAIHFIDKDTGFLVGTSYTDPMVYYTMDGGNTWTQNTDMAFPCPLYDVSFVPGTKKGWIAGKYSYRVSDYYWNDMMVTNIDFYMRGMRFADEKNGYGVSDSGTVCKSTDGGLSWTTMPKLTDNNLRSIFVKDVNHYWVVGYKGTVLRFR